MIFFVYYKYMYRLLYMYFIDKVKLIIELYISDMISDCILFLSLLVV